MNVVTNIAGVMPRLVRGATSSFALANDAVVQVWLP